MKVTSTGAAIAIFQTISTIILLIITIHLTVKAFSKTKLVFNGLPQIFNQQLPVTQTQQQAQQQLSVAQTQQSNPQQLPSFMQPNPQQAQQQLPAAQPNPQQNVTTGGEGDALKSISVEQVKKSYVGAHFGSFSSKLYSISLWVCVVFSIIDMGLGYGLWKSKITCE